jgi:hypothetical protein
MCLSTTYKPSAGSKYKGGGNTNYGVYVSGRVTVWFRIGI